DAVRSYEIYLRAQPDAADSGDVRERIGRLRGLLVARAEEEETATDRDLGTTGSATEQGIGSAPPSDDARPPPPGRPLVIAGATLVGLGAAVGIGGGIGFGVVANRRSDELDEVQSGGNPRGVTFPEARDLEDAGKRADVAQIA